MFRKLSILVAVAVAGVANSQITTPSPYCASSYFANYNMFQNISIAGTTLSFGAAGSFGASNTYKYYNTTTFADLTKAGNNTITVTPYSAPDFEPIYFALWIDYNQNNTFETSEIVMQNNNTINAALPTLGAAASPITKTFTIPSTALTGVTRARLKRMDGTFPYSASYSMSACSGGGSYGCTYDFNVNIINSLSVSETKTKEIVTIFPNPARDLITIGHQKNMIAAEIFTMDGRLMKKYTGTDKLDVSFLQNGEYMLKVYDKYGAAVSQKVLIAK
ncbi:hypothetical protein CHRY9390_02420 [Chryseobacterium aquaeductus]|uniref:Secretion system C-terminal sorting domain-containing protein n=1 Tax=Chryseobacterium aquaeductus TaxID=2675056 RepID=A0A9N8QR62_9FLAO|nr:T9SS type A sorting domain-containing protein [Chryseobacterium aquaeductus]CAA7331706.1 hypothetical protein CHRY9390_02420 [Chryseobacterium potabilaquae]CAD7811815.1 hypothetical protein CHRY9390_02420 [Chryseobacterium aquaeductus]